MKQAPKQINYEHFSTKTVDNYVNNSIPSFNLPHQKKYLKKQKKSGKKKNRGIPGFVCNAISDKQTNPS